MLDALRILRYSARDLWEEFAVLVALNVVWCLSALVPLVLFYYARNVTAAIGASLVLGLPLPVISGSLCYVTNQVARGKVATWSLFGEGFRRYWAKSLAVAAVNLLALALLIADLRFYTLIATGAWAAIVLSTLLVAGIWWGLIQIYWFPMILELQSEKVFEALRRAAALVIITPGFSLTVGLVTLLLTALCILTTVPALVLMGSLLLLISNHATRSRLASIQRKPYQPDVIEES